MEIYKSQRFPILRILRLPWISVCCGNGMVVEYVNRYHIHIPVCSKPSSQQTLKTHEIVNPLTQTSTTLKIAYPVTETLDTQTPPPETLAPPLIGLRLAPMTPTKPSTVLTEIQCSLILRPHDLFMDFCNVICDLVSTIWFTFCSVQPDGDVFAFMVRVRFLIFVAGVVIGFAIMIRFEVDMLLLLGPAVFGDGFIGFGSHLGPLVDVRRICC